MELEKYHHFFIGHWKASQDTLSKEGHDMNKKILVRLAFIFIILIQLILVSNTPAIAKSLELTSMSMEVEVTPTDIVGNVGTSLSSAFTVSTCTPVVTISPKTADLSPGEAQQFSATTVCDGVEVEGCYTWEIIEQGIIRSTIDANGLYTAGSTGGIDTVMVTDTANGNITDTVKVTIYGIEPTTSSTSTSTTTSIIVGEFFIMVEPGIIRRSLWVMLPAMIDIWGVNCNFDSSTKITYEPKFSVWPMPPLRTHIRHFRQLIFVMPVWFAWALDEILTVTVTTTEFGAASDTIEIRMRFH